MKTVILIAVLFYFGFGVLLYFLQRSFIYFPTPNSPSQIPEQVFVNKDISIKVSVLNQGQSKAILYFGGNAEEVDQNAADFSQNFKDFTVYLVKYRGYSGSDGKPSEQGFYSDGLHIFDQINPDLQGITVIGRSLGSSVASYIAAHRDIEKLVLITPFDSVLSMAKEQFPYFPISLILKDTHNSIGRVEKITAKTLILAGEKDEIVRPKHTKRLFEAFNGNATYQVIDDADHNTISAYNQYWESLDRFL